MSQTLQERIAAALGSIVNPRTGADVVSSEMVRDVATTTAGRVRLTILLAPDDPATLVRDVREAVERLDGVADVRVDVKDASEPDGRPVSSNAPPLAGSAGSARTLPVMNAAPAQAPRPSAPTPVAYPHLGR